MGDTLPVVDHRLCLRGSGGRAGGGGGGARGRHSGGPVLYIPHTPSGELVVDGVLVSAYATALLVGLARAAMPPP